MVKNDFSTPQPRDACTHRPADRAVRTSDVKRPVQGSPCTLREGFVVETVLVSMVLGLMIGLPVVWH